MKALVTGGTGFLGSHIAERLVRRGDLVRALVRPTSDTSFLESLGAVEFVRGDVTDEVSLRPALSGVDVAYHAAAMVSDWGPWEDFRSVTVNGTRNMLRAATAAGVGRFLYVSTDGVYRYKDLRSGVTEESLPETQFGAFDYYRKSKAVAEKIVRRHMHRGDLPIAIVRPALVFGERDASTILGIIAFLKGPRPRYLGSGRNRLPCVYGGDVAELCIAAATSAEANGQIYNGVNEEYVTQRDLFQAAAEMTSRKAPEGSMPFRALYAVSYAMELRARASGWRRRPQLTRFSANMFGLDFVESAEKAHRELGWEAEVGFREAVRRSVEWARARRAEKVSG